MATVRKVHTVAVEIIDFGIEVHIVLSVKWIVNVHVITKGFSHQILRGKISCSELIFIWHETEIERNIHLSAHIVHLTNGSHSMEESRIFNVVK